MKRRTLVVAGAALACASAAVGLLAGFVPPQEDFVSLRRRAGQYVAVAGPEDMPRPIERMGDGVRVWAVRRDAVRTVRAPGKVPATADAVVSFDDRGVRLELGAASLRFAGTVAPEPSLAPLVSMDGMTVPALVAGQPVRYGEALDMRGRPLRWQGAQALLEGYSLPGPRVGELDFDDLMPLPLFTGGLRASLQSEPRSCPCHHSQRKHFHHRSGQSSVGHGPHAAPAHHRRRRDSPLPLRQQGRYLL